MRSKYLHRDIDIVMKSLKTMVITLNNYLEAVISTFNAQKRWKNRPNYEQ